MRVASVLAVVLICLVCRTLNFEVLHHPALGLQQPLRTRTNDRLRLPAAMLIELVAGLEPWDLQRAGIHERVGRLTVNDLLHEWVHHDRTHSKQILGIVQAYVWPQMGGAQAFTE